MTDSKATFLKDVKDLPLLTAEREHELGAIIQKRKSGEQKFAAITELIEHNMKLVVKEAYNYSRCSSVSVEELYNAGRVGLVIAVNKYNPKEFGTRFSTYATPWIRQGMREAVHGDSPVKIPLHIINGKYRKNKALEGNENLTEAELREELDVTVAQMDKINLANVSGLSLDMTVSSANDSGGENTTIGDLIPDRGATIPGEVGFNDHRLDYLADAFDELDEVSKDIVKHQVMSADKVKLSELGKKHGVSGERIRQIKMKALQKLKDNISYRMVCNDLD